MDVERGVYARSSRVDDESVLDGDESNENGAEGCRR